MTNGLHYAGIVLVFVTATLFGADASLDPVARWTFDNPVGNRVRNVAVSGKECDGHSVGVETVAGQTGTALRFASPRSRVIIPGTSDLSLGTALTLTAWLRPGPPTDESRIILAKNDEYILRIDNPREGGRLSFFVQVGNPGAAWEPRVSTPFPVTKTNAWRHVAAVWDGVDLRLYVDGTLRARRPRTGRSYPNPYPVIIGNWEYPSCHGGCFGGAIDDVRIYRRALTAKEIEHLARR